MTTQSSWHDSAHYEIIVRGILGDRWCDWFEGMTIKSSDGVTKITGNVVDQAALYGLLDRVRDLGMVLISVTRVESKE
jgi:hypothetical protein